MAKKKSSRKKRKSSTKVAVVKKGKRFPKASFLEGPLKNIKIRAIGIGGGGSSVVSEIAKKIRRASFVAANTDLQALKSLPKEVMVFQFGEDLTHGLGTGMNVQIARIACEREKDKVKKILEGKDLCILIATLGGGVASGASPVFAQIAKSLKNITFGIFTLPFIFEGKKKLRIAKNSLEKLRKTVNALVVIPNERIFQIIDKKTPLSEALSEINKNLRKSLEGLIEIIFQAGFINLDFADLRAILQGRGKLAYLNTVEISRTAGPSSQNEGDLGSLNKIDEVIKKLLNNPLYPYNIKGAKGILFNITGGKDLSLDEVSKISNTIYELVSGEAKIIFGVSHSPKYEDRIKITLLATGCKPWIFPAKKIKPPKKQIKKIKKAPEQKEIEIKVKIEKKRKPRKQRKPRAKETTQNKKIKPKIRRNALEIKKREEDILAQEEVWETPAFLRKEK